MATIDKKTIQARFAEFWSALADVKLKTRYILNFGPQPIGSMGFEQKRTTAYLLGIEPFTRDVIPICENVDSWGAVRDLLLLRRIYSCLFNGVIVELETFDHVRKTTKIEYIFRAL